MTLSCTPQSDKKRETPAVPVHVIDAYGASVVDGRKSYRSTSHLQATVLYLQSCTHKVLFFVTRLTLLGAAK